MDGQREGGGLARCLLVYDLATVVVMLPIASLVVSGMSGATWAIVVLVVDASFCFFIALISMVAGFGLRALSPRAHFGESMIRYGAGLGALCAGIMLVLRVAQWLGGIQLFESNG